MGLRSYYLLHVMVATAIAHVVVDEVRICLKTVIRCPVIEANYLEKIGNASKLWIGDIEL